MSERKNYFDMVKEARLPKDNTLSAGVRSDADEEGEWITVNGSHIHLNEEGKPDKGNPNVIAAMGRGSQTGKASFSKSSASKEGLRKAYEKEKADFEQEKKSYEESFGSAIDINKIPPLKNKYRKMVNAMHRANGPEEYPQGKAVKGISVGDYMKSWHSDPGDSVAFTNTKGERVKFVCIGKENGKTTYAKIANGAIQGGAGSKLTRQQLVKEIRGGGVGAQSKIVLTKSEYEKR